IVAHGNQIAMSETLDGALQTIFGGRPSAPVVSPVVPGPPPAGGQNLAVLVTRAWEAWTRGQDALRRGDWGAYGDAQGRLEEALKTLRAGAPRRPHVAAARAQ